jgi:hypothetical protein
MLTALTTRIITTTIAGTTTNESITASGLSRIIAIPIATIATLIATINDDIGNGAIDTSATGIMTTTAITEAEN